MKLSGLTRREVLIGSASVGAALLGGSVLGRVHDRKPTYRIAHLSDLHIKGRRSVNGVNQAIQHALSQSPKPDLILTGGDLVFDLMSADQRCAEHQWSNFRRVFDQNFGVPVEHILGNHDIWGIDAKRCGTSGNEPRFGKQWALEMTELDRPYRTLDRGGWRLILLDGTLPRYDIAAYDACLDPEQFEWFADQLANTPASKPVMVVTHEPFLSAAAFFHGGSFQGRKWTVPGGHMHRDSERLCTLLRNYPNVKAVVSGHIHLLDRIEYDGVIHCCNGAVCGAWWAGSFKNTAPGYGLIDLYADGTFTNQYCVYDAPA